MNALLSMITSFIKLKKLLKSHIGSFNSFFDFIPFSIILSAFLHEFIPAFVYKRKRCIIKYSHSIHIICNHFHLHQIR